MKVIQLYHAQSAQLYTDLKHRDVIKIACGSAYINNCISEANFHPNYSALNSCLFESSIILTIWEHADELIGNDHVAFIHTDVTYNDTHNVTEEKAWEYVENHAHNTVFGLVAPYAYRDRYKLWTIQKDIVTPKNDPLLYNCFDGLGTMVWEHIKKIDKHLYEWAFDVNPSLVYAHQFACSREVLDKLGFKLLEALDHFKLTDVGLWMPHLFERLVALNLAKLSHCVPTTMFWHHCSSSAINNKSTPLYGNKAYKYYNINWRRKL